MNIYHCFLAIILAIFAITVIYPYEWFLIPILAVILITIITFAVRHLYANTYGDYDTTVDGIVVSKKKQKSIETGSLFGHYNAEDMTYKYQYMGKEYESSNTITWSPPINVPLTAWVREGDIIKVKLYHHNPKQSVAFRPAFTLKKTIEMALFVAFCFALAYFWNSFRPN